VRRRSSGSSNWDFTGSNYVTNSHHRWGDGEPNDSGGEACLQIKGTSKWNDLGCGNELPFICGLPVCKREQVI
jgi:hypothetical protein